MSTKEQSENVDSKKKAVKKPSKETTASKRKRTAKKEESLYNILSSWLQNLSQGKSSRRKKSGGFFSGYSGYIFVALISVFVGSYVASLGVNSPVVPTPGPNPGPNPAPAPDTEVKYLKEITSVFVGDKNAVAKDCAYLSGLFEGIALYIASPESENQIKTPKDFQDIWNFVLIEAGGEVENDYNGFEKILEQVITNAEHEVNIRGVTDIKDKCKIWSNEIMLLKKALSSRLASL